MAIEQQAVVENSSVAFRPLTPEAGYLSAEEYEARKAACTQEEVAKLTASPEFKAWSSSSNVTAAAYSNGLSNGVKHCLVLAYVVVVTSILLANSSGVTHIFNPVPVGREDVERPRLWFPNALHSVTPSPQSAGRIASLANSLQKAQSKERETAKELSAQLSLNNSLQKTVADLDAMRVALEAKVKALEQENRELASRMGKLSGETASLRAEVAQLRAAGSDLEHPPRARGAKFLDQKLEEARMQLKTRTQKAPSPPPPDESATPEPLAIANWSVTVMSVAYLMLGFVQQARASRRQQSIIKLLEKESKGAPSPSSSATDIQLLEKESKGASSPPSSSATDTLSKVAQQQTNVTTESAASGQADEREKGATPLTGTAIPVVVSESKLPAAPVARKEPPQVTESGSPKKRRNGGGFFSRIPGIRRASSSRSSGSTDASPQK